MTPSEVKELFLQEKIPLADIKVVFDGYFHIPFEKVDISMETIPEEKVFYALQKLKDHYPANYLAGYMDVQGLRIFLNKDTLIPRNETLQFVYDYLKQKDYHSKKILDLCTGSGVIALSLKRIFPDCDIYASDISSSCLSIAKKSADYNHLSVTFLLSDYLKDISDTFDVIISNPPYIEEGNKEVEADFEPASALYSGKDGLDSYRSIFQDLNSHLSEEGEAFFELESTNSFKTKQLFEKMCPNYACSIWKDWYQRDRYLLTKKVNPV